MKETWKAVKGFEDTHKVSSNGKVVKIYKTAHGEKRICEIKPSVTERKNSKPIINVNLIDGSKKRYATLGRVVAEAFIPNPDNCKYVKHIDGNYANNSVENLKWDNSYVSSYHVKINIAGKEYNSIEEASKETGLSKYTILKACNQKFNEDFNYIGKDGKNIGCVENLPKEEWKYIEGTDKQFMVSNKGRIKSCVRTISCGKVNYNEKLVKQVILEGKARVNIRIYKGKNKIERKYLTVINEVYKAFAGCDNIPSRYLKNIDGNLLNCELKNIGVM